MHDFTLAFIGGTVLGVSAVGYLYINGRIAGISGIIAHLFNPQTLLKSPALYFLLGLIIVPFIYRFMFAPQIELNSAPWVMILAGLLVGIGARMGSGCTSGHGICGLSRLSGRSMVAISSLMFTGFVTVFIIRHILGA